MADRYIVTIPGYTVHKVTDTGAVLFHHEVGGVKYADMSYEMMHAVNHIFEGTVHALNALGDIKIEEKKGKVKARAPA